MSVTDAYDQAQAQHSEQQARQRELGRCYRAVFYGTPQARDQEAVRDDLAAFCGMRTSLMRPTFEDTAHAVGQFRVWQRILGFCFPHESQPRGEAHHEQAQASHKPTPGGGLAERTID